MIRQILDFSRQSVLERQVLDLLPFIKEPEKLTIQNMGSVLEQLREELRRFLKQYTVLEPEKLCDRRYERFRKL